MRTIRRMNLFLAIALLLLFGAAGCSSSDALPTIHSFSASQSAINPGGSSQLVWSVSGSNSLSIDNGVGSVTGSSIAVSPAESTTYTLTASNASGSVTATATVTVHVEVVLGPSSIVLLPGAARQFSATVLGSSHSAVTWAAPDANGGSITESGMYTAPQAAGVYHVQATSQADATGVGTALVTVDVVGISFAASGAALITGAGQNFIATVRGATLDTGVTWSVDESNGGSVVAGTGDVATYTAPTHPGTYHLRATSSEDPSKYAEIPIIVSQVAVAVMPASLSLVASTTYQFSATVTGTPNLAVDWSVVEDGGGSIGAGGLYQVPASGGPYHIRATSQADPTVSSLATVTVDAVGVSVLPTAVTLNQGATQQFSATVTGATGNSGVTWAVVGAAGGTIDANGLYTAGTTAGTDYVQVSSQENPGDPMAVVTVTVNPPPTFTVGLSPSSLSIGQNSSATTQVTVTPFYGLPGTPGISLTNPSSTTITSSYNAVSGILTVTVPASQATGGPFNLQVLGTYDTLQIPKTLEIFVTAIAPPTVTGLAPNLGPAAGGTRVTLAGSNFTTGSSVLFGGAAASSVVVQSDSQITATAPAGAAGAVDVTVTNPGGTSVANANDRFTRVAAPTVSAVNPNYGAPSSITSVVLTGSNFTGATAVLFGNVPAMSFSVVSDTRINASSPGGPVGDVDITVTTLGGTSAQSSADLFSYLRAPVLLSASATTGKSGDVITLSGTSLAHVYQVLFGDVPAISTSIVHVTDTSFDVTVPSTDLSGAIGDLTITVTTPMGTSNGISFTYD